MKNILLSKTQWIDSSEYVLNIVIINDRRNALTLIRVTSQNDYPFRVYNISLLISHISHTRFVYFLILVKDRLFIYIRETKCIIQ